VSTGADSAEAGETLSGKRFGKVIHSVSPYAEWKRENPSVHSDSRRQN